jgi:hypothetical protein
MDGMVDACSGGARIVDGYELCYGFKKEAEFADAKAEIRERVLQHRRRSEEVRPRPCRSGSGSGWTATGTEKPWDMTDFRRILHSRERSRHRSGRVQVADEYVWLYSETPRWWTKDGKTAILPPTYEEAVRRSRK